MTRATAMFVAFTAFVVATGGQAEEQQPSQALARCLAERGWVMYGSALCSACRAQRRIFGEAFAGVREIECNPNVEGARTEVCLARKVRKFPTWIREQDGEVLARVEEFQQLEDLRTLTGCN